MALNLINKKNSRIDSNGSSKKILLESKRKTSRAGKLWRKREENLVIYPAWSQTQGRQAVTQWGGGLKRSQEAQSVGKTWCWKPGVRELMLTGEESKGEVMLFLKDSEKWAGLGSCMAIAY